MMSINQIREDLKEIRYYYARKEMFDSAISVVGLSAILDKAEKYNTAVRQAPARLYDLYVSLYIRNNTQEGFSIDVGYTPEYINLLHSKLLRFFQSYFNEKEKS